MNIKPMAKWFVWLLVLTMLLTMTACRRAAEDAEPVEEAPAPVEGPGQDQDETNDNGDSDQGELKYYVLYLKHREHAFIFSDTYSIREDDPALAERTLSEFVLERLIQQRGVGDLVNPIHPDTRILSLEQDGRLLTVDLSREFAEGMQGSAEDTEATIAMLVNTMITLPGIDRVSLLIEGEKPGVINGVAIRDVYEFVTDFYPDK